MRKLVYYIGASTDGYIAGPGGEVDFFPVGGAQEAAAYAAWVNERYPETVPTPMREGAGLVGTPNRRFDTVVMGGGTYRVVYEHGLSSPYAHLRQYVVSGGFATAPDPAVTAVGGDPLALVRDLKKEAGGDIWLCGGGGLAGSLLPEIDELILKTYPVVAGAGIPVFAGGFDPTPFTVTAREPFPNGVLITWLARR
ncbi:dihydrofolate reductase [Murinocardiopsis flavida]|uniref:Dihydrofolate reductase n=1 Tax=Murinocardiopsis flavida TaxID=645275 RepID=A0A2P8DDW0_9ACTN|nr:dihydrofolate reductase family protein [Murinocardiopsis flavida]PSK95375.1 dihydrofolate reductase [Murinocardiopsis flavida]